VIGSGPAGMAAAHDLACLGYQVTVFEALPVIGGMFHIGIPSYRLPRDIIKMDVEAIRKLGVEIQTHTRVGKDIIIPKLKEYGFEAVVVAVGAQISRGLPIDGVELEGVLNGISFLKDIYIGEDNAKLGDKILVIGGGNVAIDVARTAVRMGPKEVHMVCLESREEMPADELEIEEAKEEGVILHPGLGPRKIVGSNGKAEGLECIKVASVFDSEGRFNPTFVEGTEAIIEADTIIITIGQASDTSWADKVDDLQFSRWGTIVVDKDTFATNIPGIFAAGDVATGPGIAIGAVDSGKRAAQSVDEYLSGKKTTTSHKAKMTVIKSHKMIDGYEKIGIRDVPVISPEKRVKDFEGIEIGYSEEMAIEQGKRCLRCNINTIFDSDKCILCGGCVDVCPEYCYKMVKVEDIAGNESLGKLVEARYGASLEEGVAMIKDEDRCIRCGLCARRCPVKAITMELFEYEEVVSRNE
ncbi:MAG: FAD-dependent oxidoreductase, partial [Thermodesulfobacteriota bacterium]